MCLSVIALVVVGGRLGRGMIEANGGQWLLDYPAIVIPSASPLQSCVYL